MHTPPPERICPNCQKPYSGDPQFCPHCGLNLQPVLQPKFVAGSAAVDIFLALVLCLLCLPMVVTMVIPLVLYLTMDKRYVGFRTSLRVGMILYAVLFLGALAYCGFIIFALSNHH
jgi:hypothetical protein